MLQYFYCVHFVCVFIIDSMIANVEERFFCPNCARQILGYVFVCT